MFRQIDNPDGCRAIFAEAGLLIHDHLGPEPMPGDYMNVKVWALY